MAMDIVMPKGNEDELIQMAERLGFDELILLYDNLDQEANIKTKPSIKITSAGLIDEANWITKAKKKYDIIFSPATREFFENNHVQYLINAESDNKDDLLYQKRAGLDDVMCKLAKDKNKIIVFNAGLVALADINILGRMIQNVKLCRKHKVNAIVATFANSPLQMRAPKDLDGFARAIKLF